MKLEHLALQPDIDSWLQSFPANLTENPLVGQSRATKAFDDALQQRGTYSNIYALFSPGILKRDALNAYFSEHQWEHSSWYDWVYMANPNDALRPIAVNIPSGSAEAFLEAVWAFINLPKDQRETAYKEINQAYDTHKLRDYMQQIRDVSPEEIQGEQLASILVAHKHPAPYYYCDRVTEERLFGHIGVQAIEGTVRSELHLIEPGLIHKANGGVLAIEVAELLEDIKLWKRLKNVIESGELDWSTPKPDSGTAFFYRPEPVPVNLKVILLGSRNEYAQLREYDEDFDHFFPFLADFHGHYATQNDPVAPYFGYLNYVWQIADVLPLNQSGYAGLLKVCARYTDYQQELTLNSVRLLQVLREANSCALERQQTEIDKQAIEDALQQQRDREGNLAELSRRSILEQQVRIDTHGEAIGQLNGLTVVTMGGSEFGEPSRITATIHYGDGDIIDIERKSDLSGNIHTKGVMILSAYLANQFARYAPLSVSATVVFEQSYYEVDGDSASLGELCCLMSALANIPLKQSLAITGAVDQFGNVQSIGAVNEKIEGYYALCKERGFNGDQGVIIPVSNKHQLNLNEEVIDAVKHGNFHIYAVAHVEEALEILSSCRADDFFQKVKENTLEDDASDQPIGFWRRLFS
ncbi:carboxylate--amine ligase [Idiomarina piscisalsi]|uniref:endopeptidase La n=1 Tax=Idiomarina piscisalsi TaxID=1096243 RepID=A0ABN5AWT8_9GAMM|nr:AAA family ATPase [Idiomarina piscisalsi]ASG65783.1 carboxylate--amine ligase [Idiomarina piscisalsi]